MRGHRQVGRRHRLAGGLGFVTGCDRLNSPLGLAKVTPLSERIAMGMP